MSTFSHTFFTDAISGPVHVVSYTIHPIHLCLSHSFFDWSVVDTRKVSLRCFVSAQMSIMTVLFGFRHWFSCSGLKVSAALII